MLCQIELKVLIAAAAAFVSGEGGGKEIIANVVVFYGISKSISLRFLLTEIIKKNCFSFINFYSTFISETFTNENDAEDAKVHD